jgi:hypothetical protein
MRCVVLGLNLIDTGVTRTEYASASSRLLIMLVRKRHVWSWSNHLATMEMTALRFGAVEVI